MAFKFCRPYLRLYKLEKSLYEASKGFSSHCFSQFKPLKASQLLLDYNSHGSPLFEKVAHFKRSFRFIHQTSSFYGKVIPYTLSDIGEGIVEVAIKEWLIKPGDRISQFDPICEVQSDKASVTISSRYDGIVKKLYHEVDATAKVGAPLIDIELDEESNEETDGKVNAEIVELRTSEITTPHADEEAAHTEYKLLVTPAVRRLARENNIDLLQVKGSGKSGRILKEDVLLFISKENDAKTTQATEPQTQISSAIPSDGKDVVQEITGIRKAMVKSMTAAWKIPLFAYCDEVNAVELVNMKEDLKRIGKSKGLKITFMPFLIKATSLALNKYPILNSVTDENCERITIKSSHNIGVSIDSPHGLVVPNIKNVQKLDIFEIARELNRLQEIAAKGRLGLDDLRGGTVTLSNIGIIGGTYTNPIILPPEVLIGGIGKIQMLPRFDANKNVVEAHIFRISWVADHRIIDGATTARFSNLWKLYVEHPRLLLSL